MTKPAIFLDRDGTIIEDVGVLSDPAHIRLFDDTIQTLSELQKKYLLFVVTNQGGIARGELSRSHVDAVNRALDAMLRSSGVTVQAWYVCPHDRSDECRCIKPNPTFLQEAAKTYNLDLSASFVMGDHPHDVATGDTVGAFGLYVLTGHGMRHLSELPESRLVFHTLSEAGQWMLSHPNPTADLQQAIEAGAKSLCQGQLTAFPTETVYGLGADALNPRAVAQIFEVKRRPLYDPLIVHVAGMEQALELVHRMPPQATRLMEQFWPGPLTLVMPKSEKIPDIVTSGSPTVAIRMSSNPLATALIRRAGRPVAAPSANLFGRTSPTTADHVRRHLQGGYSVLIDGGACRIGIESTVLSLVDSVPMILRHGGISKDALEAVVGPIRDAAEKQAGHAAGPGMLESHYAPVTPLTIVEDIARYAGQPEVGKLLFSGTSKDMKGPCEVLSRDADVREAAVNLYYAMRRLDSLGLKRIVAERMPQEGLGIAINDRLKKASAKRA